MQVALRTTAAVRARFARSARTSGVRCAAGMSPSVAYPKPIVFPALGEHKSTLVMLHGLGETLRGLAARRQCRERCGDDRQQVGEGRSRQEPGASTSLPAALPLACRRHTATHRPALPPAGDSGSGWADIAPMLGPDLPNTQFIFPTAPTVSGSLPSLGGVCVHRRSAPTGLAVPFPCLLQRPVTLNGGMCMNAWYDIAHLDRLGSQQDAEAMHESLR